MISISHLITGLDLGGAEGMLVRLVKGMDRQRYSNCVISLTDRGQLGSAIESADIPLHCLGMRQARPSLSGFLKLIQLLRSVRPMVVQSWLYHADCLSVLAAPFAGGPTVAWNLRCSNMNMTNYSFQSRLVLHVLELLSWIPKAVIVNSEAGRDIHTCRGFRARRWEVIPNGFDLERFCPSMVFRQNIRTELHVSDNEILVGMVARVDPMKDYRTFFKAARQIIALRANVRFVCIGTDSNFLNSMVVEHGLVGKIHLLGARKDVHKLFPGFDICCLSSAYGEGFPNVLGEAMSCEVPCVSTDVGDARAIIGETGVIVAPQDPHSFAAAVVGLIDKGQDARKALGRLARERIQSEFSLPDIIRRYESFYETLI